MVVVKENVLMTQDLSNAPVKILTQFCQKMEKAAIAKKGLKEAMGNVSNVRKIDIA